MYETNRWCVISVRDPHAARPGYAAFDSESGTWLRCADRRDAEDVCRRANQHSHPDPERVD